MARKPHQERITIFPLYQKLALNDPGAIEEINRSGGVLGGRKPELLVRDNRAVTARAAAHCKELAIDGLKEALVKISTLRGLLPICAACKKIRDDRGYWNQIETYISKHTGLPPVLGH
jgi:hypothetical protein